MASINPSFAVAAAIRADIVTILKARANPEETAKSISPSLAVINQWATQIPLLLAGPNSGCLDVVFALRKDLFNGPNYIQPSIGLAMEQLPESFHIFINMTRDVIALQKPDKPSQKVRFCLFYLVFLHSFQSAKRPRLIKSKATIDDEEVESILDAPDTPADEQVCQVDLYTNLFTSLIQAMVLDDEESVSTSIAPFPAPVIQDPVYKNQKARDAVKRVRPSSLFFSIVNFIIHFFFLYCLVDGQTS